MKKQPYRRDYLKEAYLIARGEHLTVKREHVKAAIECLDDIRRGTDQLRHVMIIAYNEACKNRKLKGLPIPPLPPSLKPGGILDPAYRSRSNRLPNENRQLSVVERGSERGLFGPGTPPATVRKTDRGD